VTQTKPKRSLAGIAGIVAIATLISKVAGLVRQLSIAAFFGLSTAKGAYDIAGIIPAFFLILLGGINGPFHSAMVSALSKRSKEESAPLVETISTVIGAVFLLVTVAIVIAAPLCIDILAPGLRSAAQDGLATRELAIHQLQIMAPMVWFAGMIGIGFGSLNAADMYWLPSISPLLSSVTLILGIGVFATTVSNQSPQYAMIGSLVLAGGTLVGTILQWITQFWAQRQAGLGRFRLRFDFRDPGVREIFNVMGPALFSSGMLQINVITDMFFLSMLPNAVKAIGSLDYANLLIQTPLGILSNMILVPFLPVFSRLADPQNWDELKQRIRQGLLITATAMLPLGALIITLATPIVRVVYERGKFTAADTQIVAPVLMAYAVGMFVYLGRDVLVRVFYALGDGDTPFRVSVVNIFLNALFDFILVRPFGAPGVILATVSVNIFSVLVLLWLLDRKLNGLPLVQWSFPILGLTVCSGLSGLAAWVAQLMMQRVLPDTNFLSSALELSVAGILGLLVFGITALQLRLPEVDQFIERIRERVLRR
jgi:putative peptidoglycan lipid II flippase